MNSFPPVRDSAYGQQPVGVRFASGLALAEAFSHPEEKMLDNSWSSSGSPYAEQLRQQTDYFRKGSQANVAPIPIPQAAADNQRYGGSRFIPGSSAPPVPIMPQGKAIPAAERYLIKNGHTPTSLATPSASSVLTYAENFSDPRQQVPAVPQTRAAPGPASSVDRNLNYIEKFASPATGQKASRSNAQQRPGAGFAQTRPEIIPQTSAESAKSVLAFVEGFTGSASSTSLPRSNRQA